jgi:3-hydroxyacyl-CoA dehydrogenase
VPEELETKRKVFAELDRLAPRHSLLATNSSSPFPESKARRNVRKSASTATSIRPAVGMNMADIMGGTRTSPESLSAARAFVSSVACVPLPVQKEMNADFDVTGILQTIHVPTLVLHARGDVRVPFNLGQELAAGIPGEKFVTLESRNHMIMGDEPVNWQFFDAVFSW